MKDFKIPDSKFTKFFPKLIPAIIVLFLVYLQAPNWINNYNNQGKLLEQKSYKSFSNQEPVLFPLTDKNSVVIFWASWCAPCKLEMRRIKSSIESESISRHQVFAINPFEDQITIKKFLNEHDFPFQFLDAASLAEKLNIRFTPTTVLLEKLKIDSMKTGLSFIGIWRIEYFLNN